MAANHVGDNAAASGCPKALLFRGGAVLPEDEKLTGLLDCLGASWEPVRATEILRQTGRFFAMAPASCVAELLNQGTGDLPTWIADADSVFLYGFGEDGASQNLLRFLTGDPYAKVRGVSAGHASISISSDFPEFSGPLSGMQFEVRIPEKQTAFHLSPREESFQSIISSDQGQLFISVHCRGARFFLSASAQIVDVFEPRTKYFDVKEKFCDTVPIVMYAKWASGTGAAHEINACLIVDDPPLKPRYGFLRYGELLQSMNEHKFATTIAFIPWNWHRTDFSTVRLFHENPEKLSLCIHGCDHTSREFADPSMAVMNKRINLAIHRMQLLTGRTFLQHQEVMVFPQGAFSASAARALKLNGFLAAANTEVAPVDRAENKTKVADLFSLAIMKYASFPIFTRRYLAHGPENFAFDGLLGKPCLIATHHDDFAGDAHILLDAIAKLNSLNWKLRWRPLGEAISRTFSMRTQVSGDQCVEMYGTNLVYQNSVASSNGTKFIKRETDLDNVQDVTLNGLPLDRLQREDGYIKFEASIPSDQSAELRVIYSCSDDSTLPLNSDGVKYRAKAVLRRYLSEFRDNYLSQNELLQHSAVRLKEALRL